MSETPDRLKQLHDGEYDALEAELSGLQKRFEAGQADEVELREAYLPFQRPDNGVGEKVKEWMTAYPDSYPAHTALASWFLGCAWEARGGHTSNLVSDRGRRGLHYFLGQAEGCANYATTLTSNPLTAWLVLAYVANTQGCRVALADVERQNYPEWYKAALEANPHSYALRRAMLTHLRTEWGGSEESMLAFVRQQQDSGLLSSSDMQKLWADFHVYVSHYALNFGHDPKTGVERAELAANMRELQAEQLFIALTSAKRPEAQRKAALERYLSAAELDEKARPQSNFYWALYHAKDWVQPLLPRVVRLLKRASDQGDDDAAIALGRLRFMNRNWDLPNPLIALIAARERGNVEAAETIVQLQEIGLGMRAAMTDSKEKRHDILKAADLGSGEMSWRVYQSFDAFQKQFELEPRAKYRYLLCAADAGDNDARFELAQQLRAGFVEVGEDGVLRPVDTRPIQDSLDYAKYLLERAAAEEHKKAQAALKKAKEKDWDAKTAKRVALSSVADERKTQKARSFP